MLKTTTSVDCVSYARLVLLRDRVTAVICNYSAKSGFVMVHKFGVPGNFCNVITVELGSV